LDEGPSEIERMFGSIFSNYIALQAEKCGVKFMNYVHIMDIVSEDSRIKNIDFIIGDD
jgi:hypothetical protein